MPSLSMTLSGPRLRWPLPATYNDHLVYSVGSLMQVAPDTACLLAGVRRTGHAIVDFEGGSDSLLFRELGELRPARAVPLLRNEPARHPRTGQALTMVKFVPTGGFVPLGACLADGRPHPHAGTGFVLGMSYGFPADHSSSNPSHENRHDFHWYLELLQLAFDGQRLRVTRRDCLDERELLPGWRVTHRGLGMAVPDGEDFLYGLTAGPAAGPEIPHWHPHCEPGLGRNLGSGVSRWRRGPNGWRPVSFVNLSGPDLAFEPSLVRVADGGLLFTVRGKGSKAPPGEVDDGLENTYEHFRVWRAASAEQPWERVLHLPERRAPTPVVINRTVSGQPFLSANPYLPMIERDRFGKRVMQQKRREQSALWPLSLDGRTLGEAVTAFDAPARFGPARQPAQMDSENRWFIDHPIGAVLRLGDGQWHALQAMRVTDAAGTMGGADLPPHAGLWVEEISDGQPPAALPWNFGA